MFTPFLSADQPKLFLNFHCLFDIDNIINILSKIDTSLWPKATNTIIYISRVCGHFPIDNYMEIIYHLEELHAKELELSTLTKLIALHHGSFSASLEEISIFSQNMYDGQLHFGSKQPCKNI